jgi:hypothetical protein
MRVHMKDGRVFEGDSLQVVRAMQDVAFDAGQMTVRQYIAWMVRNVSEFEGIELEVRGNTDREMAESFVSEMLRAGLASRVRTWSRAPRAQQPPPMKTTPEGV